MSFSEYFAWYSRSVIGIVGYFGGVAAGIAAFALGLGLPLSAGILAGIPLLVFFGAHVTGIAARQALAARDAAKRRSDSLVLEEIAARRERLAALRVREEGLRKAIDRVVIAAGEYVAAAGEHGRRDPLAEAALGDSIELVDLYRAEADERARERRFDLPDADPFADAETRVVSALEEKAQAIARATGEISGLLPAVERMEIREELT